MDAGTIVAISFSAVAFSLVLARAAWYLCARRREESRGVGDREGDLCCTSSNVLV